MLNKPHHYWRFHWSWVIMRCLGVGSNPLAPTSNINKLKPASLLAFLFCGTVCPMLPCRCAGSSPSMRCRPARLCPGNVHDLGDWHGGDVAQLAVGVLGGFGQRGDGGEAGRHEYFAATV